METPESSNIAAINYSTKKKVLTVDFKPSIKESQTVKPPNSYEYYEVPKEVFDAFKAARKKKESVGKLFAASVKGKYEFNKVPTKIKNKKGIKNVD